MKKEKELQEQLKKTKNEIAKVEAEAKAKIDSIKNQVSIAKETKSESKAKQEEKPAVEATKK